MDVGHDPSAPDVPAQNAEGGEGGSFFQGLEERNRVSATPTLNCLSCGYRPVGQEDGGGLLESPGTRE